MTVFVLNTVKKVLSKLYALIWRAGDFVPKTDIRPLISTGELPDGFFLPDVIDRALR